MDKLPILKIDPEFKDLIRPLRRKEYLQLEENILDEGCRDPIIVWNDYIIDGHNRYSICTKYSIPFNTVSKDFASREEVIVWIRYMRIRSSLSLNFSRRLNLNTISSVVVANLSAMYSMVYPLRLSHAKNALIRSEYPS